MSPTWQPLDSGMIFSHMLFHCSFVPSQWPQMKDNISSASCWHSVTMAAAQKWCKDFTRKATTWDNEKCQGFVMHQLCGWHKRGNSQWVNYQAIETSFNRYGTLYFLEPPKTHLYFCHTLSLCRLSRDKAWRPNWEARARNWSCSWKASMEDVLLNWGQKKCPPTTSMVL